MSLSQNEEYLVGEVERLQQVIVHQRERLQHARGSVEILETIVHKAAQIAGHLPYLCESLQEPTAELLQAALQLETLLVQRKT